MEINGELRKQIKVVSINTGLKPDTVLDLLQHGWVLIRKLGKPTKWVQGESETFKLKPESIQRKDKYNITIDGFEIRANDEQLAHIRSLHPEQLNRFRRIMGGKD